MTSFRSRYQVVSTELLLLRSPQQSSKFEKTYRHNLQAGLNLQKPALIENAARRNLSKLLGNGLELRNVRMKAKRDEYGSRIVFKITLSLVSVRYRKQKNKAKKS